MLNLRINNQRGDTLVEVTLAVAILAMVLASAYAVIARAAKIGRSAKERSQAVALVQQQAEIIQSFAIRDWDGFITDFQLQSPSGSSYRVSSWTVQGSKSTTPSAAGFQVYYVATCYKFDGSNAICRTTDKNDIAKISFNIKADWKPVAGSNKGGQETTQAVVQVSPSGVKTP